MDFVPCPQRCLSGLMCIFAADDNERIWNIFQKSVMTK